MPGFFDWLTNPLISRSQAKPVLDSIDSPTGDYSPWEARLRGFVAGGLDGARETFTSPFDLMASASGVGMAKHALKAPKAIRGLQGVRRPTFDLVENTPVQQVKGSMDDVDALIGDMQRNLARVPTSRRLQEPMETLGERAQEFTPVGGENLFNVGRQAASPLKYAENPAAQAGFRSKNYMTNTEVGQRRSALDSTRKK